jgi:cell division protein FtsW
MAERTVSARQVTRGRHPSSSTAPARSRPATTPTPGPVPRHPNGPSTAARPTSAGDRARPRPTRPTAPPRARGLRGVRAAPALAALVGALCVFGLVMVGSASPIVSLGLYGSPWAILIRQALYMGVGAGALLLFARMDYRRWRRVRGPLLVVSMGLLVVVLVPHLGVSAGGSSRWIGIGMLQLQPSELMKLALAVFAADLLTRRPHPSADPKLVIVPVLAVLGIAGALILKQPDMGTAMVLACIAFGILFMGGVPVNAIMKILGSFAAFALVIGLADPYRRDRILSFLNPGANKSGTGYQVWQSLIGLGSGHIFGLGLGGGREKYGTLPNAHTDFIFSVVGEELGLIGAIVLLCLFFALAWFGLRAAIGAPDRFGSLLAVGITTWITSQAVINIGAVIGVLPVTGIPLPFISFGGSSLIITMAAFGILVNIATQERSAGGVARAGPRPSRR